MSQVVATNVSQAFSGDNRPGVRRFHAFIAALTERPTGRKALSKTAIKVFAILVDHADDDGIAYPSLSTIAALADVTVPQASAGITELREHGCLDIAEHGTRTRSTRHRMTFKGLTAYRERRDIWRSERRAAFAKAAGQVLPNLGVPVLLNSETATPESGNTVLPNSGDKPPTESPRKGRDEVEGLGKNGSGPGGPSRSAHLTFDSFWAVYPKGRNKDDAERELQKQLDAGAAYEDIIAGACRYADFCRVKNLDEQYIKYAKNFLSGRHWRDTYPAPRKKVDETEEVEAASKISEEEPRNSKGKPEKRRKRKARGATDRKVPSPRRAQNIAGQWAPESVWRPRVAAVAPAVAEFVRALGFADAKSKRDTETTLAENARIRRAVESYIRETAPSSERSVIEDAVGSVITAWQRMQWHFEADRIPPLFAVDAFEGIDPLTMRVARHHIAKERAERNSATAPSQVAP